jgi:hypothetical protein
MIRTKELFDEASSLPIEMRMQLVEKPLRSLNPTQKEIDKLWAKEAEKRVEDIRSKRVKTIPEKKYLGRYVSG